MPGTRGSTSNQARRTAFLSLIIVSTLVLAGCKRDSSSSASTSVPQSSATARSSYVALGDSYTAGPGIPDQTGTPSGCQRSSSNYPSLVSKALGLDTTHADDVSCSGATIADLTTAQETGNGTNPAQLSALSANTTIVTIGIGGNDVDFSGVLTHCVELDLTPTLIGSWAAGSTPCKAFYTTGGTDQISQKIQDASANLASAVKQIQTRAPHAHVYVVGYPDLVPSDGAGCAHTLGITSGDLTYLNEDEVRLNSMLRQQAQATGAIYVDAYAPSQGHDACSDPDTRWIEPLIPSSAAAPLHPNARGEQGMANAVLAAIKATA